MKPRGATDNPPTIEEAIAIAGVGDFVDKDTLEYFRRREQAERTAAKTASCDVARRVHQELAQHYAELLRNG